MPDAVAPLGDDHDESHNRREPYVRHARPIARRTVAGAKATGPWRLIMPVRLLLLGVLRPISRRTRRDRQAGKRELSVRLDVVRFLLCAERHDAAEVPARLDNIRFSLFAERQPAALGRPAINPRGPRRARPARRAGLAGRGRGRGRAFRARDVRPMPGSLRPDPDCARASRAL